MGDSYFVAGDSYFVPLTEEQLAGPERPQQIGPLRWYDKEMRCASRGCGSSTYCKLEGVPYCMMHSLRLMNRMLSEDY